MWSHCLCKAINHLAASLVIDPNSVVKIQRRRVVEIYLEQLDIGEDNNDLGLIKNNNEISPGNSLIINLNDDIPFDDHSNKTTNNTPCIICSFNLTSNCKTMTMFCCNQVIHTYCYVMWSTLSNKCANCNMLIPISTSISNRKNNEESELMIGTKKYTSKIQNDQKLVILRGQQQNEINRAKQHSVKSKSRGK